MRKFIVAVALLLGVVFIISRMTEVKSIADTLKKGDLRYVFLALGVQGLWIVNIALQYWTIYRELCIEAKLSRLIQISIAADFVNIVAPSAGMGGMAVFISEAQRDGHSAGRVTVAGVMFVLFDYLAFFCILALGLGVLLRRNNLTSTELIATGILIAIAGVMAFLTYQGMRSEQALANALSWIISHVNRLLRPFIHRDYLSEKNSIEFAHEAADGLRELRQKPRNLITPFIVALVGKLLLVLILWLVFLAFQVPYSPGTIIGGWSIGYLFLIVSPTPAGLGVVEGALALALTSLNVPLGAAAVITLAYRGITYWMPLLVGMIAFRWLSHGGQPQLPAVSTIKEPQSGSGQPGMGEK
jgi:glycosyltransferase 2 family protein